MSAAADFDVMMSEILECEPTPNHQSAKLGQSWYSRTETRNQHLNMVAKSNFIWYSIAERGGHATANQPKNPFEKCFGHGKFSWLAVHI
jgi:hypothetical protein